MEDVDLPGSENVFRASRPGGSPLLDPRAQGISGGGLLGEHGKVAASKHLPALAGRFQDLAMSLPADVAPYGQGIHVRINPELPVLQSNLTPWIGAFNDPGFKQDVMDKQQKLQTLLRQSATPTARRHGRETERIVRTIHQMMGRVPVQDMGVTIELGLMNLPKIGGAQQVLSKAKPATVRDMHILLAYFLSGAVPPEAATMEARGFGGSRKEPLTARHSVRMALEGEGGTASRYMFGASTREHIRRLQMMQDQPFHMMAGVGLQSPPGARKDIWVGEPVFSHPNRVQQLSDFEEKLLAGAQQDVPRATRAAKQTKKGIKKSMTSVARSFVDVLSNVLMEASAPLYNVRGASIYGQRIQRERQFFEDVVLNAYAETSMGTGAKTLVLHSPEHMGQTLRLVHTKLNKVAEKIDDLEIAQDVRERAQGLQEDFIQAYRKSSEGMKAVQEAAKPRSAARQTAQLLTNPSAEMRLDQGLMASFKKLGVNPPKAIPAILVAAMLAGALAISGGGEEAA